MAKRDEVKIIHHFIDGTVSDTLEGHVIPDNLQREIFKIFIEGQNRRRKAKSAKSV